MLKEEKDLVESVYVDVSAWELGGLLIIEACCDKKNLKLVEEQINNLLNEIIVFQNLTLDEIKKAINIVKSNYVFNLETSSQLSSFFGNELLWGRKNTLENIESHLNFWNNLNNFAEIVSFLSRENFTFIASPK